MKAISTFKLALAETRRSGGKLIFCVFSIALGVGSLTAVRTAVGSLEGGIAKQARSLMGADLVLRSNRPLKESPQARKLVTELHDAKSRSASLTEFYSMLRRTGPARKDGAKKIAGVEVKSPRSTRLVRVRAVESGFPFYGKIFTEPAGRWESLKGKPIIIADPNIPATMGLKIGDRVRLGKQTFTLAGTFVKKPGSPASGFGLAPAIYIHDGYLDNTGLLARTGARVRYFRMFRAPADFNIEAWKQKHFDTAIKSQITIQTFRESSESLQRFLSRLSHFLTIVGLITLLLGGLGIGSAMSVFIKNKLDHAAILRSMGARPMQVVRIYFMLAMVLGIIGSLLGVIPGALLPVAFSELADSELAGNLLPIKLEIHFSWLACVQGIAAGLIATFLFTLLPVYRIHRVSPLRVLRHDDTGVDRTTLTDIAIMTAGLLLLFGFIVLLTVTQTNSLMLAFYFTGTIALAVGLLAGVARLVIFLTKRVLPSISSYHLRQGVANLYRPGNQTGAVITAVGIGVLLIASIYIIESSIQSEIAVDERGDLPNNFIIDIQPDQKQPLEQMLASRKSVSRVRMAPMISARIDSINGKKVDTTDVERNAVRRTWSDRLRTREYFITYRDYIMDSEEVVKGKFWKKGARPNRTEASVSENWALRMDISIGDVVALNIENEIIQARITSFRKIKWQAMSPNSIIVLSPGDLIELAPRMYVMSYRLPDEKERFQFQEDLIGRFTNISVIDVTEAVDNVRFIMGRVSMIIRFLAAITLLNGMIILGGAIAAGRFARLRESMLLKVLGAGRKDLRRILMSEYAVLAVLGCACGWLLAEIVNRTTLTIFFTASPVVPYLSIAAIIVGIVILNVGVGMFISRDVSNAKPMSVLREE